MILLLNSLFFQRSWEGIVFPSLLLHVIFWHIINTKKDTHFLIWFSFQTCTYFFKREISHFIILFEWSSRIAYLLDKSKNLYFMMNFSSSWLIFPFCLLLFHTLIFQCRIIFASIFDMLTVIEIEVCIRITIKNIQ